MKKSPIIFPFLFIPVVLFSTITREYYVTGGEDATGADLIYFPCTALSSSDDTRWTVGNKWPDGTAYDETIYVLFTFSPDIPSDATITSVKIVSEYTVDKVADPTYSKLEVFRNSDNTWNDYSLSVPGTVGTDVIDTVDITSFISTPSDVNNTEIKFLSYTEKGGPAGDYITQHDFLQIIVATTDSTYYYTPTGGDDHTSGVSDSFPESKVRVSEDIKYQNADKWPDGTAYDEAKYIKFLFSPDVPSNRTVTSVNAISEYTVDKVADPTYSKLEVFRNSDNTWNDYSLSVPGTVGTDVIDTVDITSFISTPSDVNNTEIKFLSYTEKGGPAGDYKTQHDLLKLIVTYSTITDVNASSLAPDSVVQGSTDVAMEELTLSTDIGWAYLDSITIENRTSAGTVNYADISLVKLYMETDGTAGFQTTDFLISSGPLTDDGLGGTVTLPIGDTISTSGTIFYIVYDISTTATAGDYIGAKLADSTYLNILSPDIASNTNFPVQSNGTLIDAPSTAIELSCFTGIAGNGFIRLFWNGGGVERWEIWRRSENEMEYSLIASMSGNDWKNYSYTDRNVVPFKTYHYLLKGGENKDSISLMITPAKNIFSVSPNISTKGIKITYSISEPTFVSLKIIDLSGRVVSKVIEGQQPPGIYSINYQKNIKSGVYFIILHRGKEMETKKFIKL